MYTTYSPAAIVLPPLNTESAVYPPPSVGDPLTALPDFATTIRFAPSPFVQLTVIALPVTPVNDILEDAVVGSVANVVALLGFPDAVEVR